MSSRGENIICWSCGVQSKVDDLRTPCTSCPNCGSRSVPMDPHFDVTLTLNWYELRCLVQWAQNYIESIEEDRDLEAGFERLLNKIRAVKPHGYAMGLTLLDEIQDIRNTGLDVTIHQGKKNQD